VGGDYGQGSCPRIKLIFRRHNQNEKKQRKLQY
jgi:hypothetical protein